MKYDACGESSQLNINHQSDVSQVYVSITYYVSVFGQEMRLKMIQNDSVSRGNTSAANSGHQQTFLMNTDP